MSFIQLQPGTSNEIMNYYNQKKQQYSTYMQTQHKKQYEASGRSHPYNKSNRVQAPMPKCEWDHDDDSKPVERRYRPGEHRYIQNKAQRHCQDRECCSRPLSPTPGGVAEGISQQENDELFATCKYLNELYYRGSQLHSLVYQPQAHASEHKVISFIWLAEVIGANTDDHFSPQAFMLAVSYTRQIMHLKPQMKLCEYQKYLCACFALAVKMDFDFSPKTCILKYMTFLSDGAFTYEELYKTEFECWKLLDYNLCHATIFEIAYYITDVLQGTEELHRQVQTLCFLVTCTDLPERYTMATLAFQIVSFAGRYDPANSKQLVAIAEAAPPEVRGSLSMTPIDFPSQLFNAFNQTQETREAYTKFTNGLFKPPPQGCRHVVNVDVDFVQNDLRLNKLLEVYNMI